MDEQIKFGKKVFIRNAGKDEYWLQDIIYSNPSKLGLGELVPVAKEKKQSHGGRLDILLKDPEDDSMYEIEVMLGETDPSHIIRAIEYWDNEKRRYPQRQHFCVLIAESFDRRYFNVMHILSLNVPMIAIQADLLELNDGLLLNFSKILDIYEEPEEEQEVASVTEDTWQSKAKWTLQKSKKLLEILSEKVNNISLKFTQSYIVIVIGGRNSYYFNKRTEPNSVIWFNARDEEKEEAIKRLLDSKKIDFNFSKKYKEFNMTIGKGFIEKNKDVLIAIHDIRSKEFNVDD